jgi:hypothetical protein
VVGGNTAHLITNAAKWSRLEMSGRPATLAARSAQRTVLGGLRSSWCTIVQKTLDPETTIVGYALKP